MQRSIEKTPPKKILLVEDSEGLLEALYRYLNVEGLDVIKCRELAQAEYALKSTFFDLVIADIRLTRKGREGLELITYVKEQSPGTQTIVMTAYGSDDIRKEAYVRGAMRYFEKPVNMNDLNECLGNVGIPLDHLVSHK